MNTPDIIVDFKGCKTRAEARERFAQWIDRRDAEQVRVVTARWFIDDGAACDQRKFQIDLAQLRAAFLRWREEALKEFDRVADEVLRSGDD